MQLFKIHGKNTFESEVRLFHADNYVYSCSRTTSKLLNHQFSKMKREKQREAERRRKTNSIHIHDLRWNVFWICCSCFFSVILCQTLPSHRNDLSISKMTLHIMHSILFSNKNKNAWTQMGNVQTNIGYEIMSFDHDTMR